MVFTRQQQQGLDGDIRGFFSHTVHVLWFVKDVVPPYVRSEWVSIAHSARAQTTHYLEHCKVGNTQLDQFEQFFLLLWDFTHMPAVYQHFIAISRQELQIKLLSTNQTRVKLLLSTDWTSLLVWFRTRR